MGKFCEQCGAQLQEGSVFCSKCGASTGMQVQNTGEKISDAVPEITFASGAQQVGSVQPVQEKNDKKEKKGKKAVIMAVVAAVAVMALLGTGVTLYLRSDGYQCKKNMQLAEKSYEAEEYKEALAYYKDALALDDTLVDAYLKSADIYVAEEDFEDALKILKKGMKKIEDEESRNILNEELVEVYLAEADYFLKIEEYGQAANALKAGQEDVENSDALENKLVEVYLAEADYFLKIEEYGQAANVIS